MVEFTRDDLVTLRTALRLVEHSVGEKVFEAFEPVYDLIVAALEEKRDFGGRFFEEMIEQNS